MHPTLARVAGTLEVRFEWSRGGGRASFRDGAVALARIMLERQTRDLERRIGGDAQLLLSAVSYLSRGALVETLLELALRRACFGENEVPRTRAAFEAAVEAGRAQLYPALEETAAAAGGWFAQARAVRSSWTMHASPRRSRRRRRRRAPISSACSRQAFSDRSPPIGCARSPAICERRSAAGRGTSRAARSLRRSSPSSHVVFARSAALSEARARCGTAAASAVSRSSSSGSRSTGYRCTLRSSRPRADFRRAPGGARGGDAAWFARVAVALKTGRSGCLERAAAGSSS